VSRGDDVELIRTRQHLLQRDIRDRVLDDDAARLPGRIHLGIGLLLALGSLGALPLLPGVGARGELALGELVAPVAERALGELLYVALVHQGDAVALVGDGIGEGGADQPLRAFLRYWLDADAGSLREADARVGLGESLAEQLEKLLAIG